MSCCETFCAKLCRRKTPPKDPLETPLKRCLNIFDLCLLGIGDMIGAGVFILSGFIAREKAGPGIVLCYLFAGAAMLLSSLCYAEFGARMPKAGSAYTYTYLTIGEIYGFVIGWNVILERMLSGAAVARGWSSMFDAMFDDVIRNVTLQFMGPIDVRGLSSYPDFVAFAATIVAVIIVGVGVLCLNNANMLFTVSNLLALCIIIALGFWKADWDNWSSEALGGFLPYGWQGVVAGTATLFYTFVGFESITNAAEEASDPATQIPIATIAAILFTTIIYMCSGAALTLMVPFNAIDVAMPFPAAFRDLGLHWVVYVVAIGALFGITASMLTDLFALPRNVYAMASDGLFFRCFAHVHPQTQTPLVATVTFGLLTAVLALLIDYQELVELLSVGTLTNFTTVAICVIVNRYRPPDHDGRRNGERSLDESENDHRRGPILKGDFADNRLLASIHGSIVIYASLAAIIICTVVLALLLKYNTFYDIYGTDKIWVMVVLFLSMLGIFTALFYISAYEEVNEPKTFSVPLLPHTPAVSIIINVALLVQLPQVAWIRYGIWLVLGLIIYLLYGVHHSYENKPLAEESHSLVSYSALESNDELCNEP
ncbi:hypothetical protein LSH36_23g08052 [Paralvinella palmiformis]|uniref:Cationic amino acid transporter C-terminal domain-containing protein n=1 Tax=Paralvinella palmiformis TaxID=53620 RepID=A0AAD9KB03_9ANNE|nr:hypothetical protein LSH36_23g08052 [Paralvinella palmiformis]